jgi:putative nucleotidyltransferase with HDIG domain
MMTAKGWLPAHRRRENFGKGEHQIEASACELAPEALVAFLRETLESPNYRAPVLPSVAVELMKLTRQPHVALGAVRQLLERDSMLAARVLQLAQSALYSRGAPIRSLDEAISRLGLRTLEELFLQTVLSMRVFRASGFEQPMENLMRHSMLTAHLARIACRLTAIPDEFAFLCGLLHDVGMAAGLLILADQRGSDARRLASPAFEEIAFALQIVHEEASAVLADAWNLHPEVRLVIGIHHHFQQGRRIHPMAAVLCVADWVASEAGTAIGTEVDASRAREAREQLGFSQQVMSDLAARARETLELAL